MKKSEHQQEFIYHVALLIIFAFDYGIKLTGGELFRTLEQQKIYLNEGKTKTLNSNHIERLAIDFNFFIDGELTYDKEKIKILGDYWESLSKLNRWGGNFETFIDTPHFERNIQ